MKQFKYFSLLFISSVLFFSCKKEITSTNPGNQNETFTDAKPLPDHACYITYTEDDFLPMAMKISYNRNLDPESIKFPGTTALFNHYDKLKRLIRTDINKNSYWQYIYNRRMPVPSQMNLYVSDIEKPENYSLYASVYFEYDEEGRMISQKIENFKNPDYGYNLTFRYDNKGNLSTVYNTSREGVTFTEITCHKYDENPNLMPGNPWLKYILLFTGFEPYYYLMLSNNNAAYWTWVYDPQSPELNFKAQFTYNINGFPNIIYMDLYDSNRNLYGEFKRKSISTCDNDVPVLSELSAKQPGNKVLSILEKLKSQNKLNILTLNQDVSLK